MSLALVALAASKAWSAPGEVHRTVDLIVPVKELATAKSRLLGAADAGAGDPKLHVALVCAILSDTIAAAMAATAVRRVHVLTRDPVVRRIVRRLGAGAIDDSGHESVNAAIRHAVTCLRRDRATVVGVLPGDLPALKSHELDAAIAMAAGRLAYCRDHRGTGTTLLLSRRGGELDPRFGQNSAGLHGDIGAERLTGHWPSLSTDVDTPDDLRAAEQLGLGPATTRQLETVAPRLKRLRS